MKNNYNGKENEKIVNESFVLHMSCWGSINLLKEREAGKLLFAMFYYNLGEMDKVDELIFSGNNRVLISAWDRFARQLIWDKDKYNEKRATNTANAKKGASKRIIKNYKNLDAFNDVPRKEIEYLIRVACDEIDEAKTVEEIEEIKQRYKKRMDEVVPF